MVTMVLLLVSPSPGPPFARFDPKVREGDGEREYGEELGGRWGFNWPFCFWGKPQRPRPGAMARLGIASQIKKRSDQTSSQGQPLSEQGRPSVQGCVILRRCDKQHIRDGMAAGLSRIIIGCVRSTCSSFFSPLSLCFFFFFFNSSVLNRVPPSLLLHEIRKQTGEGQRPHSPGRPTDQRPSDIDCWRNGQSTGQTNPLAYRAADGSGYHLDIVSSRGPWK